MPYCLAPPGSAKALGTVKRFDARCWSVDFPRPMMASVVTTGPHSLRVEALFYRADDLAGLIWEAEDRHDHPLLAYETSRDFRRCTLRFRWRSGGLVPLDAVHGPTLTIEGRDAAGAARSWYVRLWNYAAGTGEDAEVALDFAALAGGWTGEDPVWAGDVDRMFVSLVAPGYAGTDAPLGAPAEGWAELSEIGCDGSGSVLAAGDAFLPEHGLRIASGYDDQYHLTPERLLRNLLRLGWRGVLNHYVGMSHYFRLGPDMKVAGALNPPCAAWHRDLLARAKTLGIDVILSLSYEAQVRDAYLGNPIAQRAVRLVAECVAWAPVYAVGDSYHFPPRRERDQGGARKMVTVPGLVTPALLETVASQLLLHGNAYVQIVCDAAGEPAELFALRPERVRVEADAAGWPAAYLYKAGEAKSRLAARDALGRPALVHLKAMHPLDDHYGLGCLGAAAAAVAVHNAAARWNKALLDNAARPSGALVFDAGEEGAALSAEQFARLREEIDAQFAGAGNAGRPMLLEGGLKWQAMSLTPADMDFAGLKAAAAREIALAFGVPPMLLGLPGDSTYANYKEANRALWRLAVLPLAGKILSGIGAAMAAWWPGLALAVDVDQVTALSEDRERLWAQVSGAGFLSDAEKREMLGFAPAGGESE